MDHFLRLSGTQAPEKTSRLISSVRRFLPILLTMLMLVSAACSAAPATYAPANRLASIPATVVKVEPDADPWQPVADAGWSQPVPLGAPVNTAGAEDSPFLTIDGKMLYFFFTPDLNIPAQKQLGDGVTGIWAVQREGEGWGAPKQVYLAKPGEAALDGCPFVLGEWMYFCSARAGNYRDIDIFTAQLKDSAWSSWQNAGKLLNVDYQVGELHITTAGEMVFGSKRAYGLGGSDLWVSRWTNGAWGAPENLGEPVNTNSDENRPFISADGMELWFDGTSRSGRPGPSVFRSLRQPDGTWGVPVEIITTFAGEPTLSPDGKTLYFVHHYFSADMSYMIEADIYVSQRQ
jgi:hypothetical protein